jgi:hypothetical protein
MPVYLRMEAAGSSITVVTIHQTAYYHNPEYSGLNFAVKAIQLSGFLPSSLV